MRRVDVAGVCQMHRGQQVSLGQVAVDLSDHAGAGVVATVVATWVNDVGGVGALLAPGLHQARRSCRVDYSSEHGLLQAAVDQPGSRQRRVGQLPKPAMVNPAKPTAASTVAAASACRRTRWVCAMNRIRMTPRVASIAAVCRLSVR